MFEIKDLDYLILKGHILTENSLHFFIEMTAVEKINFKKIKLTYSTKIEMAKTLGLFKYNPELYNELKTLNKLRNSIAHNLKYDQKLFTNFLKGFKKNEEFLETESGRKIGVNKDVFKTNDFEDISNTAKLNISMLHVSDMCIRIFNEGAKLKREME